ncbi:retrovirus-related pol polyprotein from transposon TNT 1-94 [Tanacetum coccineum]
MGVLKFVISKDELIDSAFARFYTIITGLNALDEGYSSKNYVRKFLRALHFKWRAKVTVIEESKDLTSLLLNDLIRNLKVHKLIIKKDSKIVKGKGERKSLALKDRKESSDEETSTFKSRGIRRSGLHVMKLGKKPKDKIYLTTIDENSTLWQRRLGHVNMRLIQSLASKELVRNLPKLKFDQHLCDACKIGKQAHVSHKAKNMVSTTRCLELFHMDLFGPFPVRSYKGNFYTLVIVDDYSRTDRDREFDNEVQFGEFCNANGITHNFSAPRTPQSNGVYDVSIKEDTAYCCLHFTKDHEVNKINTPYLENPIRRVQVIECEDFGRYRTSPYSKKPPIRQLCDDFAKIMHDEFEMSMMGKLNFFLGLQVNQMKAGIFFNQSKYIKEMLKKFSLEDYKAMKMPRSSDMKLTKDEECESVDSTKYRGMIGSLLYLMASRPDIMSSVCLCARFKKNPKTSYLEAVNRIFRYIKGTTHLGLWYPKGTDIETVVYADSNHAGDYVDRKSTSGICTFVGCCLTSWFSKKQTVLAISTTEDEYISIRKACQQELWMKQALIDYDI